MGKIATPPTDPPALDAETVTDRALMDRIQRGDPDAFRTLVHRHLAPAQAVARRLMGDPHLAEDAVQEALAQAWTRARLYDPSRGSVRGWILSLVHHRAVDMIRREESQVRRVDSARSEAVPEPDDPGVVVVARLEAIADRDRIHQAMGTLPPAQRQVIRLMYFHSLSQSQVARLVGIPLGTVKTRALKAIRRLRAELLGDAAPGVSVATVTEPPPAAPVAGLERALAG